MGISLVNGSALDTDTLLSLAERVSKQVHPDAVAATHILVSGGGEGRMDGWAYPPSEERSMVLPDRRNYLIYIVAGEDDTYPHQSFYRDAVGPLEFLSWEDEFFAYLAHKWCHVMQWMGATPEVDEAEQFAKILLAAKM